MLVSSNKFPLGFGVSRLLGVEIVRTQWKYLLFIARHFDKGRIGVGAKHATEKSDEAGFWTGRIGDCSEGFGRSCPELTSVAAELWADMVHRQNRCPIT